MENKINKIINLQNEMIPIIEAKAMYGVINEQMEKKLGNLKTKQQKLIDELNENEMDILVDKLQSLIQKMHKINKEGKQNEK